MAYSRLYNITDGSAMALWSNGMCAYLVASIVLLQCKTFTAAVSRIVIGRNLHKQISSDRNKYASNNVLTYASVSI